MNAPARNKISVRAFDLSATLKVWCDETETHDGARLTSALAFVNLLHYSCGPLNRRRAMGMIGLFRLAFVLQTYALLEVSTVAIGH
jgi:hypothetical protein